MIQQILEPVTMGRPIKILGFFLCLVAVATGKCSITPKFKEIYNGDTLFSNKKDVILENNIKKLT